MPESGSALQNRFESAVGDVERHWRRLSVPVERLTAKELAAYRANEPVIGWRVPVPFSDQIRRLDILVSRGFPFSPARIALVDRPDFLDWAHVEKNGLLCLLPEHSTLSVDDPYGAIANLLMMACDLVESLLQGGRQDELRSEFLSYWGNTTTLRNATVLSLVRPGPPARVVRVWQGGNRIVVADSDDILRSWLRNLNRKLTKKDLRFEDGIFAWLEAAPLPSEYPKTAGDVRALAESGGAADLLDQISQTIPDRLFLLLATQTTNGPAEVAIVVERPPIVRNSDPLTRGFRPSSVPEPVFKMRYFGATPVTKAAVERVDPEWVHGRGQDARFARLRLRTVLLLGCGSIGAPVAIALGHAGIGRLILVDNQPMKAANVGRHPLGVPAINEPKATALAARLRSDLPHLVVDSRVCKAEDLLHRQDGVLDGVDLIVSAMGNWSAEAMLDEWHHSCGRKLPVVYGWTEAHAAAGHAVAILTAGARLRDGVDATGAPNLTATQWVNDPRRQEPACGAAFEPYGPVELGYVTSLVAETALDCILNPPERSIHRIWLGRRSILERAGGQWTPAIQMIAGAQLDGGVTLERQWGLDQKTKVLAA
jgi:molybdopterin/thiamine biosynthesis adenylyltransferase